MPYPLTQVSESATDWTMYRDRMIAAWIFC